MVQLRPVEPKKGWCVFTVSTTLEGGSANQTHCSDRQQASRFDKVGSVVERSISLGRMTSLQGDRFILVAQIEVWKSTFATILVSDYY